MTSFQLTAAVLGTPDPRGLARFYQRWPPVAGTQQMQAHLDIAVDDLAAADAVAVDAGARLLESHGDEKEEVHVYADPAGHPFCLFARL